MAAPKKKIPLSAWAAARYDPPPSAWVLRRWAREGEIHPQPELVGREYYCREDAVRLVDGMDTENTLVDRLRGEAA